MAQKEAREGLPANVLDFKGHPYYALERHLKRNEVIHPKREVGKVNAGSAKKPRMESVYRRNDVLQCRSGDKWYRAGRQVNPNEHPLKYVRARKNRDPRPDPDATADPAQAATIGLYSFSQTSLYVPPPVRNGRVPRNAYGNLDIYAPSMIPAGGTHIRDAQASRAALMLRVDFADAVTGFSFKGRHGTAVIAGIIVANEHADAVHAALESFREDAVEEASRARSLEALRLWKRFVVGLRITERVSTYGGTESHQSAVPNSVDENEEGAMDRDTESGGVSLDETEEGPMPTAGRFSISELTKPKRAAHGKRKQRGERYDDHDEDDGEGEDFNSQNFAEDDDLPDDNLGSASGNNDLHHEGDGGFLLEDANIDTMGGGFLPEDADDDEQMTGGGFLPEDADVEDYAIGGGFAPAGLENEDESAGQCILETSSTKDCQAGSLLFDGYDDGPDHDESDKADLGPAVLPEAEQRNDMGQQGLPGSPALVSLAPRASVPPVISTPPTSRADLDLNHDTSQTSPYPIERHDGDGDSILSHDPEDDDAEPDWLESD
jgi:xeroderma pigmentosum group C-complementing protein